MTALNCAAGDLAVVVTATLEQNIGVIVEVLGARQAGSFCVTGGGHQWIVKAAGGTPALHYRFRRDGRIEVRPVGPVPDRCLRPIRPAPRQKVVAADQVDEPALA